MLHALNIFARTSERLSVTQFTGIVLCCAIPFVAECGRSCYRCQYCALQLVLRCICVSQDAEKGAHRALTNKWHEPESVSVRCAQPAMVVHLLSNPSYCRSPQDNLEDATRLFQTRWTSTISRNICWDLCRRMVIGKCCVAVALKVNTC